MKDTDISIMIGNLLRAPFTLTILVDIVGRESDGDNVNADGRNHAGNHVDAVLLEETLSTLILLEDVMSILLERNLLLRHPLLVKEIPSTLLPGTNRLRIPSTLGISNLLGTTAISILLEEVRSAEVEQAASIELEKHLCSG